MRLDDFKKLEEKVKGQDFHRSYKNIDRVMFYLSIFGNLASIFLAYFLVNGVLSSAISNPIVSSIGTIILLTGLELLKREIFDKFSLQQIKDGFTSAIIPLLITSFCIVSLSFYATISGAREFSSKEKELTVKADSTVENYQKSIDSVYDSKIATIKKDIDADKSKIELKDKEQTEIESQPAGRQQRNRVRDLKEEKTDLKSEIIKYESNIESLKKEKESEIIKYQSKVSNKTDNAKDENKSNTIFFVFLSTIIEIMIISGVYFNEYYKFKSYREFKSKIEKDPNYQNWISYNSVLDVIYTDETQLNDKIPSIKNILDLCKIKGIGLLPKDITSIIKVMSAVGILRTAGSAKYVAKSKDTAQEIIKKHFNIK